MTRTEVAQILARIKILWPSRPMPEGTAETWHEALADEPSAFAIVAVAQLAKTDDWPPSLARFVETRRQLAERDRQTQQDARALDEGVGQPCDPDAARRWLTQIRDGLAQVTKRVP